MPENQKFAFFRQSGWLVIATFAGGLCMALVHTVARKMGPREYATFVSLLRLMVIMGVPASALQTIFARQAAAATNENHEQQLRATTRALLTWTFLIGIACGLVVLVASGPLSRMLSVSNPAALYFLVLLAPIGLWIPIGKGLLQGKHSFGGLGWLQISEGALRFSTMMGVIILGGRAAGGMLAVAAGQVVTVVLGAWLTREFWRSRPTAHFRWKHWFGEAVPMTFALGTVLVMSSLDMLFVQGLFSNTGETALYSGAMLTGFAIIQFIAPVALVMFARVAQNVARAERSDSLGMTLIATIAFGVVAAIGSTIFPKLPLRFMYFSNREMWEAAPLVPWFAWALLPLTVANVLVQNILARARFEAVPWLMVVPAVYAAALCVQAPTLLTMKPFPDAFVRVIQTLGCSSLLLCAVAAWFSRPTHAVSARDPASAPARAVSDKSNSPAA